MSRELPKSLINDIDIPKLEDLTPGKRTSGQTVFTLLSGIASIIGLYGFYDVVIKNSYGEVLKGQEGFILSVVSLLTFASYAFVIFYAYNQRFIIEEKVSTLYRAYALLFTKQYKVFHIVSVFSAVLQELRSISVTQVGMQAYEEIEPEDIHTGIQDLVDRTATIFRQICSKNCSVTVKRIVRVSGQSDTIRVETMTRDATSAHERSFVDTIPSISRFDHTSNTAFRVIIDPSSPDNYFLCNDLKQLAGEGQYQNSNPYWSKSYNACLVVPIYNPNSTSITEGIFGFMCVDTLEGSFDDDISLQILRVVSNLLFEYLLLIERLDPDDGKTPAVVSGQQQTPLADGVTTQPAPATNPQQTSLET